MSREEIALADALQKYVDERAPMHSEVMLRRCISALHRAAPAQGEPVAWRWRTLPRFREDGDIGEWSWEETAPDFMNPHHHEVEPLYADLPSSPAPTVSEEERHAIEHARYMVANAGASNPDCCFDYELVADLVRVADRAFPSSPVPNRNCPKCGDAFPCKCVSYGSPVPDASPLNSGECEPVVKSASGSGEAIFSECAEIAMGHVGARRRPIASDSSEAYDGACRDIAEAIRLRASNRKTMDAIADAAQGEKK
jgi:hypothetical protein